MASRMPGAIGRLRSGRRDWPSFAVSEQNDAAGVIPGRHLLSHGFGPSQYIVAIGRGRHVAGIRKDVRRPKHTALINANDRKAALGQPFGKSFARRGQDTDWPVAILTGLTSGSHIADPRAVGFDLLTKQAHTGVRRCASGRHDCLKRG